jgi:hypothetical protein
MNFLKDEAISNLVTGGIGYSIEEGKITNWYSEEGHPMPSSAEIQAEITRLQAIHDSTQYQRDREPEYPPMSDYLDGIVKDDTAQVDKYISDCLAVKAKYPKPE